MPIVFRDRGVRFFFSSNEGMPREPVHIHVGRDDCEAKFWIKPAVAVAAILILAPMRKLVVTRVDLRGVK